MHQSCMDPPTTQAPDGDISAHVTTPATPVPTERGRSNVCCARQRAVRALGDTGVGHGQVSGRDDGSQPGVCEPQDGPDLRELEDELCRLAGIHAVRVVGDRSGRPVEVHVLADHSKPAKQTVRDVRAVAQTVFGIELDHRIVSVAQLNTDEQNTPVGIELPRAEARRARRQHQRRGGRRPRRGARRTRSTSDRELTGYAEGSVASVGPTASSSPPPHSTPFEQGEPAAEAIHVASAEISRIGPQPRRGRHRRLRRPAHRARRLRVRGRAPRPRRRRRPRAARRDQPPARPRSSADARRADPRVARDPREPLELDAPSTQSNSRTGSAAPTAWPSRRASGNGRSHELGFDVRRVAGELDDGLRPDDAWLPFLAIDPADGDPPGPRRARRRHRRRRPRRSSRTSARCRSTPTRRRSPPTCSPSTTVASCSTITTSRGSAPGSPTPAGHPAAPRRTRCT